MSRLIDADALKDTLLKYNYTTSYNQIFRYIDETPTAYDVDKVVEDLDKASDYYECEEQGREHVQMVDLSEAIEIVKGGGVNGYVSQEQSNDIGNKKRG